VILPAATATGWSLARSGVDGYHFEWQVDLWERCAARRQDSLVITSTSPGVLQGTPEDVRKQARYAIEAGVHLIGLECAIPLSTPLENLESHRRRREGY
jgi:[methyl-Co(III) methanol-specific corrinoid protein]:coenzyme M methyltransferase